MDSMNVSSIDPIPTTSLCSVCQPRRDTELFLARQRIESLETKTKTLQRILDAFAKHKDVVLNALLKEHDYHTIMNDSRLSDVSPSAICISLRPPPLEKDISLFARADRLDQEVQMWKAECHRLDGALNAMRRDFNRERAKMEHDHAERVVELTRRAEKAESVAQRLRNLIGGPRGGRARTLKLHLTELREGIFMIRQAVSGFSAWTRSSRSFETLREFLSVCGENVSTTAEKYLKLQRAVNSMRDELSLTWRQQQQTNNASGRHHLLDQHSLTAEEKERVQGARDAAARRMLEIIQQQDEKRDHPHYRCSTIGSNTTTAAAASVLLSPSDEAVPNATAPATMMMGPAPSRLWNDDVASMIDAFRASDAHRSTEWLRGNLGKQENLSPVVDSVQRLTYWLSDAVQQADWLRRLLQHVALSGDARCDALTEELSTVQRAFHAYVQRPRLTVGTCVSEDDMSRFFCREGAAQTSPILQPFRKRSTGSLASTLHLVSPKRSSNGGPASRTGSVDSSVTTAVADPNAQSIRSPRLTAHTASSASITMLGDTQRTSVDEDMDEDTTTATSPTPSRRASTASIDSDVFRIQALEKAAVEFWRLSRQRQSVRRWLRRFYDRNVNRMQRFVQDVVKGRIATTAARSPAVPSRPGSAKPSDVVAQQQKSARIRARNLAATHSLITWPNTRDTDESAGAFRRQQHYGNAPLDMARAYRESISPADDSGTPCAHPMTPTRVVAPTPPLGGGTSATTIHHMITAPDTLKRMLGRSWMLGVAHRTTTATPAASVIAP